jgi:hypothetical protein
VYRKKWVIHIERITREKVNGERGGGRRAGVRARASARGWRVGGGEGQAGPLSRAASGAGL